MALCHSMGCGEADTLEGELLKRPPPNKVADDSAQSGRSSFGRNGFVGDSSEIDSRVLIDPKMLLIGSKIGEGAHGKVYEGKYCRQIVAVKVLNKGDTPEEKEKCRGRFIREVNMMSRVNHENLVKGINHAGVFYAYIYLITYVVEFIGACKDPVMVIATELLPGMSLKKYLGNIRPNQLDLHTAVKFALDIARAMDCLHANGIIHRDLKPDNLLLTANQKDVKLADFGLAREETLTEMMTAETGTYRWMAPELYSTVTLRRGEKKHYTNKVDVYSFGIVMWELLTNRMPFEGMSNLQAAYAAAFKQVRPPLPEDAPAELAFIVQSCWVEDPSIRPSFSQIVRMLTASIYTLPSPSPNAVSVVSEMSSRDGGAIPAETHNRNTNASQSEMSSSSRTVSSALYTQKGRKPSFLCQLFSLKRANNRRL